MFCVRVWLLDRIRRRTIYSEGQSGCSERFAASVCKYNDFFTRGWLSTAMLVLSDLLIVWSAWEASGAYFWKQYSTAHEETIYDKKDPRRKTSMHMMHCHFSLYLQIFEPMHPVFFFLVVNSLCSSTRSGNSDPTLQKALQVLMPSKNFVGYLWNANDPP